MDVVKHISTTDNIDELIHLYKVSRDYHATKDKGNCSDLLYYLSLLIVLRQFLFNVWQYCDVMVVLWFSKPGLLCMI